VTHMKYQDSHLTDQTLLLDIDGELSAKDEKPVHAHLEACWKCRTRRRELENAITDFVRAYRPALDPEGVDPVPPPAGARALLKARLAQLSEAEPAPLRGWFFVSRVLAMAAILAGLVALGMLVPRINLERKRPAKAGIVSLPDSRLTPGATVLVSRPAVCAEPNMKNKAVPVALQRKVFEEYGITGADPRLYEVDYLVTPALGGADDIHNLWPHSHSATVWNADVKYAREDLLREMVCSGSLDLAEAQREISGNWIGAYKKYFHTDVPLAEHCGRCER
jgi:hypothetical protein